jgi:hypothetical protein
MLGGKFFILGERIDQTQAGGWAGESISLFTVPWQARMAWTIRWWAGAAERGMPQQNGGILRIKENVLSCFDGPHRGRSSFPQP